VPGGTTRPPCSGGYKYGDLAFQVGVVSNLRQKNLVMSLAAQGSENKCAGEGQQQLNSSRVPRRAVIDSRSLSRFCALFTWSAAEQWGLEPAVRSWEADQSEVFAEIRRRESSEAEQPPWLEADAKHRQVVMR
jgi:hypothetical protein